MTYILLKFKFARGLIKKNEIEFLGLLDQLAVTDETKELIEATKQIFMQEGQE